jgi:hypothetical protein
MGEVHAAYAITDHIALSATLGYGAAGKDTTLAMDTLGNVTSTTIFQRKVRDREFSIGYFTPLSDNLNFEVFGGLGFAFRKSNTSFTDHLNNSKNFETSDIDNRYQRLFLQPSVGRNGKFLDFALSNRFTLISYQSSKTSDFISETVITIRYGYKNIKFMNQLGLTLFDLDSQYGYYPFFFGFGVYLMFNQTISGKYDF